jgi:hypothetical protein
VRCEHHASPRHTRGTVGRGEHPRRRVSRAPPDRARCGARATECQPGTRCLRPSSPAPCTPGHAPSARPGLVHEPPPASPVDRSMWWPARNGHARGCRTGRMRVIRVGHDSVDALDVACTVAERQAVDRGCLVGCGGG